AGRPVTTIMITNNLDEALLLSDQIIPMTRGPRATLSTPINVPIPRPRTESQLLHDETAVRIRARIVEFLVDFIHTTPKGIAKTSTSHMAIKRLSDEPVMEEQR